MPDEFTHRNVSFEKENFTFPPPPQGVNVPPPQGTNESVPSQRYENVQNNKQQKGNDVMIKWYYLLPLLLIPLLLFFFMSENIVVADAEFLQQVKEDSSIFHKFKNI